MGTGWPQHTDLQPKGAFSCGPDVEDEYGHSTAVAGVVAALDNSHGFVGVAPEVELWFAKSGHVEPDEAVTICNLESAMDRDFDVINISRTWVPSTALTNAVQAAYADGALIIAPSGDSDGDAVAFPASLPEVIAVGATTKSDWLTTFSNLGPEQELTAPGYLVETSTSGSGEVGITYGCEIVWVDAGRCSGTSYAAAVVSAAAAMTIQAFPELSKSQIRSRLRNSTVDLGAPGRDDQYGYGRIDVQAAVGAITPLRVQIDGPMCLYSGGEYTYEALVISGDEPPFSFRWSRGDIGRKNWQDLGWGNPKSIYFSSGNYGDDLRVDVTDAEGNQTHAYKQVYMDSGDPPTMTVTPNATACDEG